MAYAKPLRHSFLNLCSPVSLSVPALHKHAISKRQTKLSITTACHFDNKGLHGRNPENRLGYKKSNKAHQILCRVIPEKKKAGVVEEEGLARTILLAMLFAGWYGANIFFNIYNKQVLKVYPYPITCTLIQFLVGSVLVAFCYGIRLLKMPEINQKTVLKVLPLAMVHTLGNLFTNISLGCVAVSFTHTIKAMEPFFSVLLSSLFLGDRPTSLVFLSLFPIVGGVAAASLSEATFNWTGFLSAMGSNLTFQSRNVLSKKAMGDSNVKLDNISLLSLITVLSSIILLPFALIIEGFTFAPAAMRAMGILNPVSIIYQAVMAGFLFHTYQQVSYMILERVSPVTHSIGNCVKRVIVIIASVLFFQNPMPIQSKIGTAVALFGVFLYSQAKRASKNKKN